MISELGWSTPILALVSAAALAVAFGWAGFAGRRQPAISLVLSATAVAAVALAVYLAQSDDWSFDVVDLVIGGLSGVGFGLAAMFAVRALAAGALSVVAPIVAMMAIAVPYAVSLALGQTPDALGMFGLLLALGAAVMLARDDETKPSSGSTDSAEPAPSEPAASPVLSESADPSGATNVAESASLSGSSESGSSDNSESSDPDGDSQGAPRSPISIEGFADGAALAALAGVAGGAGLALLHGTTPESGASPLAAAAVVAGLSVAALSLFTRRLVISTSSLLPAVVPGLAAAAAGVAYLEAVATGSTSLSLAIATSFAAILWLVGIAVLREPFGGDRGLAIALAFGATVLLSLAVGRDPVARNASTDDAAAVPVKIDFGASIEEFPKNGGRPTLTN